MEVLAGAASVFAVLSLSLQVCGTARELSDLLSSIKDAPKEVEDIRKELEFIVQISEEIRTVLDRNYADLENPALIYNALQMCNDRITALKSTLPQSSTAGATFSKWTKTKFGLAKPRFMEMKRQIGEVLQALDLALSLCTMKVQLRQNTLLLSALEHSTTVSTLIKSSEAETAIAISQAMSHQSNAVTASSRQGSSTITRVSQRSASRAYIGWRSYGRRYFQCYMIIETTISKQTARSADQASIADQTAARYRIIPSFLNFAIDLDRQWGSGLSSFSLRTISIMSEKTQIRVETAVKQGNILEIQRMLSDRVISIHDVTESGWSLLELISNTSFKREVILGERKTRLYPLSDDILMLQEAIIVFLIDAGCEFQPLRIKNGIWRLLFPNSWGGRNIANIVIRNLLSRGDFLDISPQNLGFQPLEYERIHPKFLRRLLEYLFAYYGDVGSNEQCTLDLVDLAMRSYSVAWIYRDHYAATADLVALQASIENLIKGLVQRIYCYSTGFHNEFVCRLMLLGENDRILSNFREMPLWELEEVLNFRLSIAWQSHVDLTNHLVPKPHHSIVEQQVRDKFYPAIAGIDDSMVLKDAGVLCSVCWSDDIPTAKLILRNDQTVENQDLSRECWMLTRPWDIDCYCEPAISYKGSGDGQTLCDWKHNVIRKMAEKWPFNVAVQHVSLSIWNRALCKVLQSYQELCQSRFQRRQAKKAGKEAKRLGQWRKPERRMPGEWVD